MRLAVLGDIHANHKALEAVLAHIYAGEYDGLVFVGDYITDCPYPRKTIEILRNIPQKYRTWFIRGNREDYIIGYRSDPRGWEYGSKSGALLYTFEELADENIDWLAEMPISIRIELDGCPAFIACHGSPDSNRYLFHTDTPEAERIIDEIDCGLMVCGHSHTPYIFRRRGKMIVNGGALGMPQNGQTCAQFARLEYDGEWRAEIVSVEYDIEGEVAEFYESGLLQKSAVWGRGIIGTLRHGVNYTVNCLYEVQRLAAEKGLPITDENLWLEAAENIGMPDHLIR